MTLPRSLTTAASRARLLRCAILFATLLALRPSTAVIAQLPAGTGGLTAGAPMGMPGMQPDRELVTKFDTDKNKRLDNAERKAAREWLAAQPVQGFGRGGPGGMRPGGTNANQPITPGPRMTPADVKSSGKAPVYDEGTYRTFFLEFDNADWEKELEAFNNTDVEVPAQVTIDGRTYKDVGVHFRGNSSYFMVTTGKKRSLNLSLDFVVDSQQLGGYRSFNLLNANNDPTFVRTVLFSRIANTFTPAPKVNLVRVVINGELWGTYVSQQQFNKDFLRDNYRTAAGARWHVPGSPFARAGMEYLGDSVGAYKTKYELKTKDTPERWTDLIGMFRVLNQTPPDQLEAALSPLLDIDGALRFLAVDVALVNGDGYWTRASDYSLFQDSTGKFHVIPHDMNEGLGVEEGGPGGPGGRGGPGMFGRGGPPGGTPPGIAPRGAVPPSGTSAPPSATPTGAAAGGPPAGGRGGMPMMIPGTPELDPLVGLDNPATPLRSKLLAVPSLRARYLRYVREIAERDLDWKTMSPLVEKYQKLIRDDVSRDTRKLASTEAFTSDVAKLKEFADKRRAFLLAKIPPSETGR